MISQEGGLGEFLATFATLKTLCLLMTGHVLDAEFFVFECSIAPIADILPVLIGQDVLGYRRLQLDLGCRGMESSSVDQKHLAVVEDDVAC